MKRKPFHVVIEVILIIVACIAIRVCTILDLPYGLRGDARDYFYMAAIYKSTGIMKYPCDENSPLKGIMLVNHRPPLYPWVLSHVVNTDDTPGTILRARLINIASDCFVVLALYVAFVFGGFSIWAARVASLLVCLNAGWDAHFLTEPLFTALFAISVCCAFLKRNVILSGLAVGAAILCRSVAIVLPLLYIAKNFRRGIYVALMAATFPLAWGVRNYAEFGHFEPFTCNRQFHKVTCLTDFGITKDEIAATLKAAYTSTHDEFEAERVLKKNYDDTMKRLGGFMNKGWLGRISGFTTIQYGYEMGEYLENIVRAGQNGAWKYQTPPLETYQRHDARADNLWKYQLLKVGFYWQWFLIYPIAVIALIWMVFVRKQYALPLMLSAYAALYILSSKSEMRFVVPILPWIAFIAGEFLSQAPQLSREFRQRYHH